MSPSFSEANPSTFTGYLWRTWIVVTAFGLTGCGAMRDPSDTNSVSPSAEGKMISSLRIRYVGEKTVDELNITRRLGSQPGTRLQLKQIDQDIRNLYESGYINDLVFSTDWDQNSLILIATVETRPVIGPGTALVGNTVFTDMKLANLIKLGAVDPLNKQQVETARRKLEKYYRRKGYPDVHVSRMKYSGKYTYRPEELTFEIQEGSPTPSTRQRLRSNRHFIHRRW